MKKIARFNKEEAEFICHELNNRKYYCLSLGEYKQPNYNTVGYSGGSAIYATYYYKMDGIKQKQNGLLNWESVELAFV